MERISRSSLWSLGIFFALGFLGGIFGGQPASAAGTGDCAPYSNEPRAFILSPLGEAIYADNAGYDKTRYLGRLYPNDELRVLSSLPSKDEHNILITRVAVCPPHRLGSQEPVVGWVGRGALSPESLGASPDPRRTFAERRNRLCGDTSLPQTTLKENAGAYGDEDRYNPDQYIDYLYSGTRVRVLESGGDETKVVVCASAHNGDCEGRMVWVRAGALSPFDPHPAPRAADPKPEVTPSPAVTKPDPKAVPPVTPAPPKPAPSFTEPPPEPVLPPNGQIPLGPVQEG